MKFYPPRLAYRQPNFKIKCKTSLPVHHEVREAWLVALRRPGLHLSLHIHMTRSDEGIVSFSILSVEKSKFTGSKSNSKDDSVTVMLVF